MKILVVNDDGYDQTGINLLVEKMKKYGSVYVVAPNIGYSGASMSVQVFGNIKYHKYDEYNYHVEASPADCVKFGLYALGIEFDLIVSGINNGFNRGIDTLYSGTVGAALEGLLHQKKAIAFSSPRGDFYRATEHFYTVLDYVLENDLLSNEYILNINFPKEEVPYKGITIANLRVRKPIYNFVENDIGYSKTRSFKNECNNIDYDVDATNEGYTTITPLRLTNCDMMLTKLLKDNVKK